jgi:tetratricopeptide (TPR) repeat protein
MNSSKKKSTIHKEPGKQKKSAEDEKQKRRLLLSLGGMIALVALIQYAQTISYNFVLDDYSAIVENKVTRGGLYSIPTIFETTYRFGYPIQGDELYRPLPKSLFAVLWQISPDNPLPGHLLNIVLYAVTAFLLFTVFSKIYRRNYYVPFIAALLFAVHPIHTDVVPNIKSMDEILSFLFFLLSLQWFYRYHQSGEKKWLLLTAMGFFAALLSKESAITFLAVYPLVIFFFTDKTPAKSLSTAAILLIPAILFLLLRYSVVGSGGETGMADNALFATDDPLIRKTSAVSILGRYLLKLFFPVHLTFDFSYNQIPLVGVGDWKFLISLAVHAALLGYVLMKWKSRDGIAFGILFYLVTISISSNVLIYIGTHLAERLLYVPSFGFCWVVAELFNRFIQPVEPKPVSSPADFFSGRKILIGSLVAVAAVFSALTFRQTPVWRNNLSLYESGILRSPDSHRTHFYLGLYLTKKEYYSTLPQAEQQPAIERGLAELRKAIEIYPAFADAWLHVGNYYSGIKQTDSAGFYFRKTVELSPFLATGHNNLGTVYFEEQKWNEAIAAFSEAIRLDPNYHNAYRNLGAAYGTLGQFKEAIGQFHKAYALAPSDAEICYYLGITYRSLGDQQNAKIFLDKAANLDPAFSQ